MVGLLASSHDEEPIAAREEITCTIWLTCDREIISVDLIRRVRRSPCQKNKLLCDIASLSYKNF
jgi:hypothetical protein